MPITTTHSFIDLYPINPNSRRLIIGTIHPHSIADFNINYFYGNVGSFWDILANAFPQKRFGNLDQILQTLNQHHVSITDMIRQCDRENVSVTQDAKLFNMLINSNQIRDGITNSLVDTIYFTSRFGKNNAAKLFVDTYRIRHQDSYDEATSEFTIDEAVFGRRIRAVVLYSPSNQANIGISQSVPFLNNALHYQQFANPVKQFKIDFYRDKFNFFNQL